MGKDKSDTESLDSLGEAIAKQFASDNVSNRNKCIFHGYRY